MLEVGVLRRGVSVGSGVHHRGSEEKVRPGSFAEKRTRCYCFKAKWSLALDRAYFHHGAKVTLTEGDLAWRVKGGARSVL